MSDIHSIHNACMHREECRGLHAELERLREQEPVAWQGVHDATDLYWRKPVQGDVRPLYRAAPPAQDAHAQPEPFAWYSAKVDDVITNAKKIGRAKVQPWDAEHYDKPLFAAQPAQPVVPLTDERIVSIAADHGLCTIILDAGYKNNALWFDNDCTAFARAIEAAIAAPKA